MANYWFIHSFTFQTKTGIWIADKQATLQFFCPVLSAAILQQLIGPYQQQQAKVVTDTSLQPLVKLIIIDFIHLLSVLLYMRWHTFSKILTLVFCLLQEILHKNSIIFPHLKEGLIFFVRAIGNQIVLVLLSCFFLCYAQMGLTLGSTVRPISDNTVLYLSRTSFVDVFEPQGKKKQL